MGFDGQGHWIVPPQMPPAQPVFVAPPAPAPQPYAAPTPYPVEEAFPEQAAKKSNRGLWLLAGCGCIVLLAVACDEPDDAAEFVADMAVIGSILCGKMWFGLDHDVEFSWLAVHEALCRWCKFLGHVGGREPAACRRGR